MRSALQLGVLAICMTIGDGGGSSLAEGRIRSVQNMYTCIEEKMASEKFPFPPITQHPLNIPLLFQRKAFTNYLHHPLQHLIRENPWPLRTHLELNWNYAK